MSHDEVRKAAAGKLWDRALKLQAQVVAGVKEPDDAETALNGEADCVIESAET